MDLNQYSAAMATMARASSGLQYPERFYAAASYVGFDGSTSPTKSLTSKFPKSTALLLYSLYHQACQSIPLLFPFTLPALPVQYGISHLFINCVSLSCQWCHSNQLDCDFSVDLFWMVELEIFSKTRCYCCWFRNLPIFLVAKQVIRLFWFMTMIERVIRLMSN